jgi:hypothetical protein
MYGLVFLDIFEFKHFPALIPTMQSIFPQRTVDNKADVFSALWSTMRKIIGTVGNNMEKHTWSEIRAPLHVVDYFLVKLLVRQQCETFVGNNVEKCLALWATRRKNVWHCGQQRRKMFGIVVNQAEEFPQCRIVKKFGEPLSTFQETVDLN